MSPIIRLSKSIGGSHSLRGASSTGILGIRYFLASQRVQAEPAGCARTPGAPKRALPTPRATADGDSTEPPLKRLRNSAGATVSVPETRLHASPLQTLQRHQIIKPTVPTGQKPNPVIDGSTTVERLDQVSPFGTTAALFSTSPMPSPGWHVSYGLDQNVSCWRGQTPCTATDNDDSYSSYSGGGIQDGDLDSVPSSSTVKSALATHLEDIQRCPLDHHSAIKSVRRVLGGGEPVPFQEGHGFEERYESVNPTHRCLPRVGTGVIASQRQRDDQNACWDDNYSVDHSHEEAMAHLLDTIAGDAEEVLAPSIVIDGMGKGSDSKQAFDPNLQRSSPRSTPPAHDVVAEDGAEDLLDYDLNWDEVFAMAGL